VSFLSAAAVAVALPLIGREQQVQKGILLQAK